MRRALTIAMVVVLAAVCARLALSARPRVLCRVTGRALTPPAGDERWVAWLESGDPRPRLMVVPRAGGRARALLSDGVLSGLALDRGVAYVARPVPESSDLRHAAQLLSVSLPTGSTAILATLGEDADQIVSSDGWVVWLKRRDPALPGVPFVAAAAPLTVIRAISMEDRAPRVIAALAGDQSIRTGNVELIGISSGYAYWCERYRTPEGERTAIRRAPCAGGPTETLVEESGSRRAALEGDALIWTAPSLEAGNPAAFSSVKRMRLGRPEVEVIGDWLEPGTRPLLASGRAYAQDRGDLWRLSPKREEQGRLYQRPTRLESPIVIGDEEFMFMQLDRGQALAKRPLTVWARVRSAVGR
ncbi:MAG: hypothetical protein ACE149_14515 [Armatimonadota bacterium]